MFYHVKDLQFNARVSKPDPRFARILLEAFGGANGELTSAMQYFVQAFSCHNPFPDKYDMLMDIANLGGGITLPLSERSYLNAEAKFMFANDDNVVIMLGYGYKF